MSLKGFQHLSDPNLLKQLLLSFTDAAIVREPMMEKAPGNPKSVRAASARLFVDGSNQTPQ